MTTELVSGAVGENARSQLLGRWAKYGILLLVLKLTLDFSFTHVLEPYFGYLGYARDPNTPRMIESFLLLLVVAVVLPTSVKKPSDFLVLLFIVLPVVPMLSFYGMQGGSRLYIYACVACLYVIAWVRGGVLLRLPVFVGGPAIGIGVAILASIIVLAWLYVAGGLAWFNLDLQAVYTVRDLSHSQLNVGLFGYLNQWVFRVFNILLLSWALYRRRYSLFVALLFLQVAYFGFSSEKQVLFAPVLVIAIYMLSKLKYSINVFLGSLIGMVVICSTITVIWDFSFLYSLFVRRVFYVPALLNFTYYDYFQGLEFVKLSNGALGWLFDYQLEDIPPRMVNFYLRGTVTGWANTGFLGSSYMHFGFIGMLLYSLIVGLLFRLTDSLTVDRLPIWVGLSILIDPYVNLFTGADLTSALATHGLGIGTVMLWLMSGERLNAANIRDVQVRR